MSGLYRKLMMAVAGTLQTTPPAGDPDWDQVVALTHFNGYSTGGDPYFSNVVALLHLDNDYTDQKGHSFGGTVGPTFSSTEKKFGTHSISLGGDNSAASSVDNADWEFGSGDFTLECWFKQAATGGVKYLITKANDLTSAESFALRLNGNVLEFLGSTNGTSMTTYCSVAYTQETGSWHHAAVSRVGNSIKCFIDGVGGVAGDVTGVTLANVNTSIYIGRIGFGSGGWNGYIDEVRLTKGVGRYSLDFTVPASAFPNSLPPFIEEKGKILSGVGTTSLETSNMKFGTGAVNFNPGYLTSNAGNDFVFTGDYTIEFWAYFTSATVPSFEFQITGTVLNSIKITNGTDIIWMNGSGSPNLSGGSLSASYTTGWHHIAICGSLADNKVKIFYDGVDSTALNTHGYLSLTLTSGNVFGSSSYQSDILVDELRITKGVARYTTNFTAPSISFPATGATVDPYWDNVVLGLHSDGTNNSTVFHDEKGKTVTVAGNSKLSTTQKKFGYTSGSFDGSGDYISLANSADFNMGSGAFTIEFWVYYTGGTNKVLLARRDTAFSFGSFVILVGGSGQLNALTSNNGSSWAINISDPSALTANTWVHVAFVRSGDTFTLYKNGTSVATQTTSGSLTSPANKLHIGGDADSNYFSGYLDDLRITKGVARYTTAFSVPTKQFPRD